MLRRGQRPFWSENPQSAVDTEAPGISSPARQAEHDRRSALAQPRVIVALLLILGGVVWAALRGLEFYGLSPVNAVYDLDQPPLLLVLVAAWLLYRSRRL